jgi:hypothetical protein
MNAELALYVYRKRTAVEVVGDHGATPSCRPWLSGQSPHHRGKPPRESPDCLKRRYLGGHIPRSIAFWAVNSAHSRLADHIRFMGAKGVVVGVSNPNKLRRRQAFSVLHGWSRPPALPKLERVLIRSSSVPINRSVLWLCNVLAFGNPVQLRTAACTGNRIQSGFRNSTREIDLRPHHGRMTLIC